MSYKLNRHKSHVEILLTQIELKVFTIIWFRVHKNYISTMRAILKILIHKKTSILKSNRIGKEPKGIIK